MCRPAEQLLVQRWDRDIRPARRGVAFRLALRLPQLPRWGAIHSPQPGAQPSSLPVDTAAGGLSVARAGGLLVFAAGGPPHHQAAKGSSVPVEQPAMQRMQSAQHASESLQSALAESPVVQGRKSGEAASEDLQTAAVVQNVVQSRDSGEAASEGVGAPQENGEDSSGGAAEEQAAAEVAGTAEEALLDTAAPALDGNRTSFNSGEQVDTGGEAGVSAAADGEASEQGVTHAAEQVYDSVAGDARLVFEAAAALGLAQEVVAAALQRYQRLVGAVER